MPIRHNLLTNKASFVKNEVNGEKSFLLLSLKFSRYLFDEIQIERKRERKREREREEFHTVKRKIF